VQMTAPGAVVAPAAAAATAPRPAAAAAGDDDGLDELLGLCGAAEPPQKAQVSLQC
jgi:hypothetical protein